MLIILFGTTLEMGKKSREHFKSKGFELIEKLDYIPDDVVIKSRYDSRKSATKEEVDKCDFKYFNNGMTIGFNKQQIIDAARGKKNCLLTLSAETVDFLHDIKVAYGGYVTTVFAYIDEETLKNMNAAHPNMSKEEKEQRLNTGYKLKKIYIEQPELFDDIVIYGGENSPFNSQAMLRKYDNIISKATLKERELNDRRFINLPYTGTKPYIFISYSHIDKPRVYPILAELQKRYCRIWYDEEGIKAGENWWKIIQEKIRDCKQFFLFVSENTFKNYGETSSTGDEKVFRYNIEDEIDAARERRMQIVQIAFDNSEYPDYYKSYLGKFNKIFTENAVFLRQLINSVDASVIEGETKKH